MKLSSKLPTINYPLVIVGLLFILGLCLRIFGLNWDQGHHLHPDERFLTMVTNDIKLPLNVSDYFNANISPLNPYNYPNYQFFVYGTFPIFLTKAVAVLLGFDNYDKVYLVGRFLSALFDSFNIVLLYLISIKVVKKPTSKFVLLVSSFLYVFCVLPIQLSHFYAVDTFLTFFLLATFTSLAYSQFLLAGILFGLALACKISAVYFLPIIGLFFFYNLFIHRNFIKISLSTFYFLLFTFILFRLFQPYVFDGYFKLSLHFIDNIKQLQIMSRPDGNFPPAVQWLSKIPLLYSFQNILFWGLGLPLSGLLFYSLTRLKIKQVPAIIWFSLLWIIIIYLYQGSQFAHTMRYFLPIYPFICLVIGSFYVKNTLTTTFVVGHIIFGLMFLSIYTRPHSRVQASSWIYENLPIRSSITNEYWDDPLPLYLPGKDPYVYSGSMLSLYDPDSPQKWQQLDPIIDRTDYIIMSSNRLWGSIPLVPSKYPDTSLFYQNLFAEKLNFSKLIEINSYPGISMPFLNNCYYLGPSNFPGIKNSWFSIDHSCRYPGIYLRDDIAEEAFSVYDHPKVLIFARRDN